MDHLPTNWYFAPNNFLAFVYKCLIVGWRIDQFQIEFNLKVDCKVPNKARISAEPVVQPRTQLVKRIQKKTSNEEFINIKMASQA